MKLGKVIAWEFRQNVRSKQFLLMTILIPAIIGVAVFAVTQGMGDEMQAPSEPPPPLLIGMFLAFILFLGAFMSGVMTLYGVMKEKQSRAVEMMLSSVSAWELMSGKMIGLGLAGLIQVIAWAVTAYFVAGMFFPVSLAELTPIHWITFPLYFILGYLFIASIFGSVGAAIKDIHSGGAVGIAGMIPYLPMMFSAVIIQRPDVLWVRLAGFFPPFVPGVMLLRIGATPLVSEGTRSVPAWEIAVSLVSLALGTFLMMRFATKVFEVGMLMTGKSASLRELWRWGRGRSR
ncbi:ABC transporter permease [Candidatus Bipolaricaulota bacterium]|nr:ABC transporter permease [Candidatus Bipolaricaulota bacterium]